MRLLFSPFIFLFIFFSAHLLGTINYTQQSNSLDGAFLAIQVFPILSTMMGECQLSFSERVILISEIDLLDWLAVKIIPTWDLGISKFVAILIIRLILNTVPKCKAVLPNLIVIKLVTSLLLKFTNGLKSPIG